MSLSPLQTLPEYGQSPWLDGFSRGDDLDRLRREHGIRGATSDLGALERAIDRGAYDADITELARAGLQPRALLERLRATDARAACDDLRPVWEVTNGRDGHVSLAVDPEVSLGAQVDRLLRLVARRNLLLAIPATDAGLTAIEDSVAAGISVDATLIFSAARLDAAAEAYLRGLERLIANGGDPRPVASVASLSISPVDAEADARLAELGEDALRGRLGIARARLAYRRAASTFAGRRWEALAAAGATPQRCLWAATSTSGTAYRDVLYPEQLIGANTVVALTPATVSAFERHGVVADTLARCADDAARVVRAVAAAGVDLEDVGRTLEAEGERRLKTHFDRAAAAVARRAAHHDPRRT